MALTQRTERVPAAERTIAGPRVVGLLWPTMIALAAALPRLIGLRDFFTTDEAYHWISRTERFAAAVAAGRWAETILTGHPGVSLMWLGSLGLWLEQALVGLGLAAPPDRLGHLAWLRLGPAAAHVLAVVAGYLLMRRLFRPALAVAAALLWATSPYLIAHGRLLHLDALLTDGCTLALLAALVACGAPRPLPWLALSGLWAGLALLTKGPALIVLPFVGLALFALAPRKAGEKPVLAWAWRGLAWSLPRYLLWLGLALLVVVALWPALWVAPEVAIGRYVAEIVGNGGRPNGDGQFFLGRADADPGLLFYPIAGLFRLTPLETIGLLALLITAIGVLLPRPGGLRPGDRQTTILLALAAFVLFWALVMTLGPKKFDRYTLPAWPALLILSAAGLVALFDRGWRRLKGALARPTGRLLPFAVFVLLPQAAVLLWYHPYYLSYYNPLLGGGRAAQSALLIGWGEGMDQVGAWLAARPDIGHGQVLSALPPTLQPFLPVPVQEVRAIDSVPANYAVAYLESLQRGDAPAIYERIATTVPLHSVTIHGIEYARIYQLPRPYARPLGAQFGSGLRLAGYSVEQQGSRLIVTPAWDVREPPAVDLNLFLYIFDGAGTKIAQIDLPPGGASAPPTSQWRAGEQIAVPLPIDLPAGLPAADYSLVLGLYDAGGARQPLSAGPAADPAIAGPDAALLGTVRIEN